MTTAVKIALGKILDPRHVPRSDPRPRDDLLAGGRLRAGLITEEPPRATAVPGGEAAEQEEPLHTPLQIRQSHGAIHAARSSRHAILLE